MRLLKQVESFLLVVFESSTSFHVSQVFGQTFSFFFVASTTWEICEITHRFFIRAYRVHGSEFTRKTDPGRVKVSEWDNRTPDLSHGIPPRFTHNTLSSTRWSLCQISVEITENFWGQWKKKAQAFLWLFFFEARKLLRVA